MSGDPVRFPPMGVVLLSSVRYTFELGQLNGWHSHPLPARPFAAVARTFGLPVLAVGTHRRHSPSQPSVGTRHKCGSTPCHTHTHTHTLSLSLSHTHSLSARLFVCLQQQEVCALGLECDGSAAEKAYVGVYPYRKFVRATVGHPPPLAICGPASHVWPECKCAARTHICNPIAHPARLHIRPDHT